MRRISSQNLAILPNIQGLPKEGQNTDDILVPLLRRTKLVSQKPFESLATKLENAPGGFALNGVIRLTMSSHSGCLTMHAVQDR